MNFFETKTVKLYKHINNYKGNSIGEVSSKIEYICDLTVDIQPATNKIQEKEFGIVNTEASYVLWVESAPNKNFVLDQDTYVRFEYEDYKNLYQVVDRSRWVDSFWNDDYTSFSVKKVDEIEVFDTTNQSIIGKLSNQTIIGRYPKKDKEENDKDDNEEESDIYYG